MSNTTANCFCVGKVAGCTCGGRCRCACTCLKEEFDKDNVYEFNMDWLDEADPNEGQEIHRTKGGKGAVGQAIAKSKRLPNCS
jgi:hypothetical protein